MARIGIFGGTFDPPHLGHLILASEVHYQLHLDRLLWVLTPVPPHKPGRRTPMEMRLAMVEASLNGSPEFEISTVEIDRPPPHYALDTVCLLRQEFPDDELIYVMGGDSLQQLHTWHRAPELVEELDGIGVMRRPEDEINFTEIRAALPGLSEKIHVVRAPLLEIASSDIRERVAAGAPFRFYLHPGVFEKIVRERLYQNPQPATGHPGPGPIE